MNTRLLALALGISLFAGLRAEPGSDVMCDLISTREHPRNSEGAFIRLKSGRVEFYYSQFYGGESDFSAANIAEIHTDDNGRTWSRPAIMVRNDPADVNVMSVSVLRLASGKILMFYCQKKSEVECRPLVRASSDEGLSWSAPKAVVAAPGPVDYEFCNDRAIQTYRGRIFLPVSEYRVVKPADNAFGTGPDGSGASMDWRGIALWYYSDDDGRNWLESPTWWTLPSINAAGALNPNGLQEPGVVELADGTIFGWARTDQGAQYGFRSLNGGNGAPPLFSAPEPTELKSPFSPAIIKRLPKSPGLLALWNDHSGRFPFTVNPQDNIQGREPLVAGISQDGGKTWPIRRVIEGDIHGQFSYPSLFFSGDEAWVAYNVEDRTTPHLGTLRLRRLSLAWLRQGQ